MMFCLDPWRVRVFHHHTPLPLQTLSEMISLWHTLPFMQHRKEEKIELSFYLFGRLLTAHRHIWLVVANNQSNTRICLFKWSSRTLALFKHMDSSKLFIYTYSYQILIIFKQVYFTHTTGCTLLVLSDQEVMEIKKYSTQTYAAHLPLEWKVIK